jgi:hypothetical protein
MTLNDQILKPVVQIQPGNFHLLQGPLKMMDIIAPNLSKAFQEKSISLSKPFIQRVFVFNNLTRLVSDP